MTSERMITVAEFQERLVVLCEGGPGAFPRRDRDRHILFRSIVQALAPDVRYSEKALNAALQQWLSEIGSRMEIDHVTLRRYLVDETYLMRDPEGRTYRVNPTGRGLVRFELAVASIDASALIQAAKEHTAERKRRRSEARPT